MRHPATCDLPLLLSSGVWYLHLRATSHRPRNCNDNNVVFDSKIEIRDKTARACCPGPTRRHNCVVAMAKILAALLLFSPLVTSDLLGLPTVPFVEDGGHLDLSKIGRIIVDVEHCDTADTTGHTLIPPTLLEFANTFASDLEATGGQTEVVAGHDAEDGSIFLTIGNSSEFVDAAGRWTAEAYTLNVTDDRVIITGASPLGAWWATRSVFQQRALNGTIATGYGVDAPGWGTRGIMVRILLP